MGNHDYIDGSLFAPRPRDLLDEAYNKGRRQIEDEEEAQRRVEVGAVELLAGINCPKDVREFGKLHNIPTFAEVTWVAGFKAGMQAHADMLRAAIKTCDLSRDFLVEAQMYEVLADIFREVDREDR